MVIAFLAYSVVVYTVGTQAPSLDEYDIEVHQGKLLWNAHNCIACHQLYGLGGFMGPDLTNVISNKGDAYAQAFIANGTAKMPNFQFNEADIQALIAFLTYVDSSGTSPPTAFGTTWFGTVPTYDKDRE
jgi:nitric oxide reductase subunit C